MKLFFKQLGGSLVSALIACVFLGFATYMVRKELRYRDQGVSTTAQVIRKEWHVHVSQHSSTTIYTLKYRYQDSAGETFEGQGEVPRSVWEQSEKGHDLAIEYLRDEPSESRLPVDSPILHWFGILCGTCCSGVVGLFFLFAAIVAFCKPAKK